MNEDVLSVEQVKDSLRMNMGQIYGQLVGFIRKLPLHETIVSHALQNLDQGIMWAEHGIKTLQFEVTPPPVSEAPQPSSQPMEGEENVTSTEEATEGQETSKTEENVAA